MILTVNMFQCVISVKLTGATQLVRSICSLPSETIMSSQPPESQILITSNYLDWRIDMQLALCNQGYHRIIHGWEALKMHVNEEICYQLNDDTEWTTWIHNEQDQSRNIVSTKEKSGAERQKKQVSCVKSDKTRLLLFAI